VRRVIQSEAAASTTLGPAGLSAAQGAAAGRLMQYAGVRDNPLQDALAGVGWDHAARAPLVVSALKVLSGLQGQEYQQEVLALYPSLCRLMCSSHLLTRLQLHKVFSSQFLGLLPAPAVAVPTLPSSSPRKLGFNKRDRCLLPCCSLVIITMCVLVCKYIGLQLSKYHGCTTS